MSDLRSSSVGYLLLEETPVGNVKFIDMMGVEKRVLFELSPVLAADLVDAMSTGDVLKARVGGYIFAEQDDGSILITRTLDDKVVASVRAQSVAQFGQFLYTIVNEPRVIGMQTNDRKDLDVTYPVQKEVLPYPKKNMTSNNFKVDQTPDSKIVASTQVEPEDPELP